MNLMDDRHYTLIIKAVSNLNYQDLAFLDKLKQFNYELFLASLKYGCEKLGPFYRGILEEVEDSFKKDSLRNFTSDERPFVEIDLKDTNNQIKVAV